jgi:hypothetical protein
MEYKKSMNDVKKALAPGKSGSAPVVTAQSPGVKLKRALRRLEKVASA